LFAFAERLRFPTLFWLTLALFAIDVVVPDVIPFADEVLLGLGALVLSRFRRERRGSAAPQAGRRTGL
jgi:hypothetical protein